ncbi:tRNA-dihydrouridine synthase [Breznakibacter xylanolyticus]|uniref:tRNA-dihydrouridine synthase n=1 Tax=Breznakibacter xylanolyticus TaxID=990 RepID=A0A2W7NJC1_9BACT|nr:tRNA-dihydrouridine synthase family protein [Breznakibacter xylanolyticus]PZX11392.1 tRNA-dihydrouridine synthase [Breznakibacter xylanolyticus]
MTMLYAAPLQSYTTVMHRMAWSRHYGGIDKFFTPFFDEHPTGGFDPRLLPELEPAFNQGLHVIPQVLTHSPDFLLKFANEVSRLGYREINLNMGCPHVPVVRKGMGGGLLARPEVVDALLHAFFESCGHMQLSVKMRLGVEALQQWEAMAEVLNRYPLTEVMVHPRTVKQQYKGEPHWDEFARMVDVIRHPLAGNGDIVSVEGGRALMQQFEGVQRWMIGRGWLSRPWLAEELAGCYQPQDEIKRLQAFHQTYFDLVEQHITDPNIKHNRLHDFWFYLCENFDGGKRWYRSLTKDKSLRTYMTHVRTLFA